MHETPACAGVTANNGCDLAHDIQSPIHVIGGSAKRFLLRRSGFWSDRDDHANGERLRAHNEQEARRVFKQFHV
jgi:hypothetical protein